ncbi:glycosyltransferase [Nocardioides mangrovicus]|uniref:Glycosyltransferase n=1 Tax=Nocardioides mangrovicus TaxID=2478913 RepID=A0A3L8NZK4_9ACTN|nr:glycosyltransferase [Nocardioides mangrovicus]RLV48615.1 glycosyltransferase [Nocardioides mangrovicus]
MAGPRASVVVPVYQAERHVEETLRSVLAQTYADLEVVVLDNACTDATPHILARYADDPRLRVVRNATVLPLAENWNAAVSLATGDLVKVVCADDLVHPDIVARQVAAFEADPGLALVSCRRHIVSEDTRVIASDRGLMGLTGRHSGRETVRRVVRNGGNPIGEPGCVMFRRVDFDSTGGFDASLVFPMDIDMWVRLLKFGDFHGLPDSLAAFRAGTGSISAGVTAAMYADQRRLTDRLGSDPFWQVDRTSRLLGRAGNVSSQLRHRALFLASARANRRFGAGRELDWSL